MPAPPDSPEDAGATAPLPPGESNESGDSRESGRSGGAVQGDPSRSGVRGNRSVRVVAIVVGVVAAGLVALLVSRSGDGGGVRAASPLIAEVVPQLSGELIWPPAEVLSTSSALPAGVDVDSEGVVRFDVDAARPRWVLVNFFASWCVPCEREHPALATWSARHETDGLVVGVPFGDRTVDAISFYERLGGDWPVVDDEGSRWAVAFGVIRPPESFLVTPDGVVAARWQGQIDADDPDGVIAALLASASDSGTNGEQPER